MEKMPNSLQKNVFIFTLIMPLAYNAFCVSACLLSQYPLHWIRHVFISFKASSFMAFCMNYNFYNSLAVCVLFRSMWTLIDEACMGGFESK